jgi:hypothetical protein
MESAIAKICHTYEPLQASKQLNFFSKCQGVLAGYIQTHVKGNWLWGPFILVGKIAAP